MEYRTLGGTGLRLSVLGFGGAETGFGSTTSEELAALLGSALDAGLNVIDTAECYGDGEEKIGRAVSHRRGDYFLFTKCGHASGFDLPDWDPAMLAASIDRSLDRLRTDFVDLIQLHSCSEELLRSGAVIEVLEKAREQGKVRFIGYSGDGSAARYAVDCGAFDTLQTSVNIADQEAIDLTLPRAVDAGMGVIAKRPIANAVWLRPEALEQDDYSRPYWDRLQVLAYPFLDAPAGSAIATALRFTLSCPGVSTMIVGTTQPGRWQENAKLLEAGRLTESEFESIRARWREVALPDWVGQI